MLAKSFVVAMAADIARSDYAKPTLIRSRSREWLIACRWGPDGEYLSIATAGAILDPARSCWRPTPLPRSIACSACWSRNRRPKPPALFCWCANCRFRSSSPALSFLPTATRCCNSERRSAWSARPAIRTVAVGWTAGRSARTFPTRRRPRRRRWHGTLRPGAATGSASSSPNPVAARKARCSRQRLNLIAVPLKCCVASRRTREPDH